MMGHLSSKSGSFSVNRAECPSSWTCYARRHHSPAVERRATLRRVWRPKTLMQVRYNILRGNFIFEPMEVYQAVSIDAKDFILSLLVINPMDRPIARQATSEGASNAAQLVSTLRQTQPLYSCVGSCRATVPRAWLVNNADL